LAQLQAKRDELARMQASIARLEMAEYEAQAAVDEEEESEEEGDMGDGEPKTEQEWLARLQRQQEELGRLRAAIAAAKAEEELPEEEEEEEEEEDEEDDEALQQMLAQLQSKRGELDQLLSAKAQLQERIEAAQAEDAERRGGLREQELQAVLMHRQQAKEAVDAQERKIAQLTALQSDLKARLAALQEGGDDDDDEEEEDEEKEEEADAVSDFESQANRVLELLAVKTDECQQLAAVVEEARAAGMDPQNPRLQNSERNLAARYQEIKELASFAHRLGLTDGDEEDEEDEEEGEEEEEEEAGESTGEKVSRLQSELDQCIEELRVVDDNASEAVACHPAFRKMRAMVVEKLEALHEELNEARAAHKSETESKSNAMVQSGEQEVDLSPMLKQALDKLWQRPYDCRIFTLQLLQSLSQLDNQSLCMMTSCFARYLENHSVPA
jgi:DNA repair exonuclease SbcCD ATPase subunit